MSARSASNGSKGAFAPYFLFVGPDYRPGSTGIHLFHQLCHELNGRGHRAYMSCEVTNPEFDTPILDEYRTKEKGPRIVVYPEGIQGNPAMGDVVARWILNVQGHNETSKSDLFFHYNVRFKPKNRNSYRLWLPFVDERYYNKLNLPEARGVTCFYACKYLAAGNELPKKVAPGMVVDLMRIKRGDKVSLATVFKGSKKIICYEETACAMEALMCGCEVEWRTQWLGYTPPAEATSIQAYRLLEQKSGEMIQQFIDLCLKRARRVKIGEPEYA